MNRKEDFDILHRISGLDQETSADEAEEAVINDEYSADKEQMEELEILLNADEDADEEEAMDYPDIELAEAIISESEGLDDMGNPKSAIAILASKFLVDTGKQIVTSQTTFVATEFHLHYREEFIELEMRYKTPTSHEMKILYNALEKFGAELDSRPTDYIPSFSFVIIPITALGTALITADTPLVWSVCASKPGDALNAMKILFRAEDIHICQTDDIKLSDVDAEAQRIADSRGAMAAAMTEKEQARAAQKAAVEEMARQIRTNK